LRKEVAASWQVLFLSSLLLAENGSQFSWQIDFQVAAATICQKCSTIALRHTHTHADGVKEPYEVLQILINLFVPGKLAKYFIFSGSHSTNFSLSDKCGYFLASERISPCPPF